jgi:hypothetical protein
MAVWGQWVGEMCCAVHRAVPAGEVIKQQLAFLDSLILLLMAATCIPAHKWSLRTKRRSASPVPSPPPPPSNPLASPHTRPTSSASASVAARMRHGLPSCSDDVSTSRSRLEAPSVHLLRRRCLGFARKRRLLLQTDTAEPLHRTLSTAFRVQLTAVAGLPYWGR